jgi:MurNAc alpha-1-phosphate uridylyltransferase
MQAMILAAGRGQRMGEITTHTPKPLLPIGNTTLIEQVITQLHTANIDNIVVNTHYLGDKIHEHLKNYTITFSDEIEKLESGGGIINALDVLDDTFIVTNADVLSDYDFSTLTLPVDSLAHLVLVDNPQHNPRGDFEFQGRMHTFSGIGIYHKSLFTNYNTNTYLKLGTILLENLQHISFEYHSGLWVDVGTPQRLELANSCLNP